MRRIAAFWMLSALLSPAFADDGAALFKAKCTACHTEARVLGGVRKVAEAERAAHFEKHLAGHFAPDAAQRQAIVEYLLKAAAQ